ncbi:hypothetical protein KAR91_75775 [Candidatus Pacearchaeota archaeon]|nr:hypothetical protein [Candidatus Pacearchaeota archaeon]
MPRKVGFKDKVIVAKGDIAYFLKYDTGLSKVDSIKGVVVMTDSASGAITALEEMLPYFRLLDIKRV